MAITFKPGRQEPVAATVGFALADLTSGTAVPAVKLPEKARVLRVTLRIDTAFNSGTSDAMAIQSSEGTPKVYVNIAAGSGAVAAGVYASGTDADVGFLNTVPVTIDVKWTGVGTAATTGAGTLIVEYVVDGKAEFTQG